MKWEDIRSVPVNRQVLLANKVAGIVEAGYADFIINKRINKAVGIQCWSTNPLGQGRFKATHWAEMPTLECDNG